MAPNPPLSKKWSKIDDIWVVDYYLTVGPHKRIWETIGKEFFWRFAYSVSFSWRRMVSLHNKHEIYIYGLFSWLWISKYFMLPVTERWNIFARNWRRLRKSLRLGKIDHVRLSHDSFISYFHCFKQSMKSSKVKSFEDE